MRLTGSMLRGIAACVAVSLALGACNRKVEHFEPEPAPLWPRQLPPPCDKPITDLLDGLKPGDSVGGASVVAIGKLNEQGVIPIVFVRQQEAATIVVARNSEQSPLPPASSVRYSVYYQRFAELPLLPADVLQSLIDQVVERLKRTEDKVPAPDGIRALPTPGHPA